MAIPLAWFQLKREKMRLLVALAGIGFAVILIFFQLGMRDALFESTVRFHESLKGDVFLVSPQSTSLIAMKTFSRRRLFQAAGVEGVASIHPVYLNFALWKNPETQATRSLLIAGYDPAIPVFEESTLSPATTAPIKLPDVVLFDRSSRAEFGPIASWFEAGKPVETEVAGRRVRVGGLFSLGASFGADGNLITSDLNFKRIFERDLGLIDIGMIRLQPGASRDRVLADLRRELQEKTGDVKVFSREEFINLERSYWQSGTSIGVTFNLGAIIGWVVGTVIVYQILYTDVADHLAEYATLKAMGYHGRYLLSVVLQESVILSVLGFIPAFGLCLLIYRGMAGATALPIAMTQDRAIAVFGATVVMCVVSGAIAMRKAQEADPADIF